MKNAALLSLAAIAALASEPMAVQPISVEGDAPKANITQEGINTTAAAKTMSGDSATLLVDAPGLSLNTAGGISSLPAIHGMADDRVKIETDGMQITAACPNHMNPSLSYTDTSSIAAMDVVAGITPVSQGGDSIGGTIVVNSKDPVFAQKSGEAVASGDLTGFYRNNNDARGVAANASTANDKISVSYAGYGEKAGNYKDGSGKTVKGTLYKHQNHAATIAYKLDSGIAALKVGTQLVDYEGFPNQYMDMLNNRSTYGNLSYKGQLGHLLLDANAFYRTTDHYMNKILTERTGNMPMYTEADEMGYNIKATAPLSSAHVVKFGSDYDRYRLDDWWPPVSTAVSGMGPNTYWNINNGKRDRLGLFAESDYQWSDKLSTLFGLRSDIVTMDTGNVVGYNSASNGTANDPVDANAFNKLDRSKRDVNFDFTAIARYENSKTNDLEFGFARKTRSPNIYERYAWAGGYGSTPTTSGPIAMDMAMINWIGDGNGYVGDINLKPEVAYTLSATAAWHDAAQKEFGVKFTPYFTKVFDYIDADLIGVATAGGYKNIKLLKFANHDAVLFGADLSAHAALWENSRFGTGTVKTLLGYTRGYRTDGGSLYHMMPFHAKMGLNQSLGDWANGIDMQAVAAKESVNDMRSEPKTPGYALVDLWSSYRFTKNLKLDVALTNLFNKEYALPLGGINTIDTARGSYIPLTGMGRSFNTALNLKF